MFHTKSLWSKAIVSQMSHGQLSPIKDSQTSLTLMFVQTSKSGLFNATTGFKMSPW